MKDNEIHVISMIGESWEYFKLGFTRSNSVSISFIKLNFREPYKTIAKKAGVVSCFRVQSVYEASKEGLMKMVEDHVKHMEEVEKLREAGR